MLYFDILEPIKVLPDADKGRLLVAMLEYGQTGKAPAFEGMLELAWGFVKPKIDKDEAEYNLSVLRRQYATVCRERKRKGEPEITFDEWLKSNGNHDNKGTSMMTNDNQWHPTTSTTPSTNTSTSITTSTAAAATTSTTKGGDGDGGGALKKYGKQLEVLQGTLGKGVVRMTREQMGDLIDKMGIVDFDDYMVRLANFIIENDAHVQNHYDTILKWWREDTAIEI
jgi:hypothetical protein